MYIDFRPSLIIIYVAYGMIIIFLKTLFKLNEVNKNAYQRKFVNGRGLLLNIIYYIRGGVGG